MSCYTHRGSVAEWLACWTQAQKGLGSHCDERYRMKTFKSRESKEDFYYTTSV